MVRRLKRNKKGYAILYILVGIIATFIVGIVYITVNEPYVAVYNNLTADMSGDYLTTAQRVNTVWTNWPILVIIFILIWVIVGIASNKQPERGFF